MLRRTIRPVMEALEVRDVPAVTFQTNVATHTLSITGTGDWENVQITQDDLTGVIQVDYYLMSSDDSIMAQKLHQRLFSASMLSKIVVNLGAGDDSLTYFISVY